MGYPELIEKLRSLPTEKQIEVFDFVDFLAARFAATGMEPSAPNEWTDAEFRELAMRQALRDMEGEPAVSTLDDLEERWQ